MSGRHTGSEAASVPRLLGASDVRQLAEHLGITPTKKLGQNFVHDSNTVRRIVALAEVQPGDVVLEVGPGLGSLTLGLVEAGARVVAVEIDPRLATQLPHTVELYQPGQSLEVVTADALEITELPLAPRRLVANLPYNVSVPVLINLLERFESIESALVMVQAEVGHRIAAEPGSKAYGVPSAKLAWWGNWSVAGTVSRAIFWPVPNVDSVLVSFQRHSTPRGSEQLRNTTFELIDAAFGQRRKMLRQSLSRFFGSSEQASHVLTSAGINPELRGEKLGIDEFISLAQATLAGES